ncbi:MAG: magnesium transporter [Ruminococcaceae bacterium]|nr:magnesium transporter [Oscillospiraceae bacterium]
MRINYDAKELLALQEKINKLNPVDLAEQLVELPEAESVIWIKLLNKDLLADGFALLPKKHKIRIMESLSDEKMMILVKELDEDELVDTLQELPANIVRRIMTRFVDEERRPIINQLLGYPKDSVGSIMSVDFLFVKNTVSPSEAIERILKSNLDANRLEQIWVTDESLILIGYVHLADLLRNKENEINSFLCPIVASVYATDDQEVVAKIAHKYNLAEIPVTDSEGRLIGFVPAEWAIEIMYEEYEEDLANIHGITESSPDEAYWEKSSFQIAKDRTMWLIICLLTATFTGFVIQKYEAVLATSVILTAYIPMLMDSGGNAGTQSSTTIITALYSGEVNYKEIFKVIFKEFKIGIIAGVALVIVNMFRMLFLDGVSLQVNLTVSITLLLTIVLSKIMGGILPLIAEKIKIDPTIMAGPLITTIVDTFVLLVYFEVASSLLGI